MLVPFAVAPRDALVRTLRESDNRALEWSGGPDLRSFYDEQWQRHQAGEVCVLVVEWNRFPVGQGAIHWRGKPTHPHIPDIQSLRVFDAFRGLGLGSQLLRALENTVRERGFKQVSLAVALDNPRAHALYERIGYAPVGEPYHDEWIYRDARGEECRVCERVLDLVKNLELDTDEHV